MDVAGHKKLKEKNLANILKATQEVKSGKIYQYLYPGDKTREETFDKYCDKGKRHCSPLSIFVNWGSCW
jgi:hypothetical protein